MNTTLRITLKAERDALAHAARAYALAQNFGRVAPIESALLQIDKLLCAYNPAQTGPWVLCRSRRAGGGIVSMHARAADAALIYVHQHDLLPTAAADLHIITHTDYDLLDPADVAGSPAAPARRGGLS